MRSPRAEFSKATKAAAMLRAGGLCECCGLKIIGTPEYDHILPAALNGGNDLDNCIVLDPKCHRRKTHGKGIEGNSQIARSARLAEKRLGLRAKKRGFRGSKKFNGEVTWKS